MSNRSYHDLTGYGGSNSSILLQSPRSSSSAAAGAGYPNLGPWQTSWTWLGPNPDHGLLEQTVWVRRRQRSPQLVGRASEERKRVFVETQQVCFFFRLQTGNPRFTSRYSRFLLPLKKFLVAVALESLLVWGPYCNTSPCRTCNYTHLHLEGGTTDFSECSLAV